ncbi:hypothetical protein [Streptomyces sp. NPDC057702]|uniref:hypothetical protein n=1 Tax=Streptomyces sp. NPDC057702 TaxID=3346221 RepID=UPI0036CE4ADE
MAEMTYDQLRKSVAALEREVARAAEAIRTRAQMVDGEARDTARIADQIGAMSVDPETVAETRDLARIMAGISRAAIAYAAAGDTTAKAASAAYAQAHKTHGGIHETVNRSSAQRIHDVNREWLRQD